MTSMAFSSRRLSFSFSRVSCAMCKVSARFGSTLGPRCCGASAAMSDASRWRLHVLKDDEYTPSRRSIEPSSPGCVQRSAALRMRPGHQAIRSLRSSWPWIETCWSYLPRCSLISQG